MENKSKLIAMVDGDLSFKDALVSFSHCDFSATSRVLMMVLFAMDRALRAPKTKRMFILSGHALTPESRTLANLALHVAHHLDSTNSTTRINLIPNLTLNQSTELQVIAAVDIYENLTTSGLHAASLQKLQETAFMKCAMNGAVLLGEDHRENREIERRL